MANQVNTSTVDQKEWDAAKQGLPDQICRRYAKDDFFAKAQQIGITDPKLVRALYVVGGYDDMDFYLEMSVMTLMSQFEETPPTPERVVDAFCRRIEDSDKHRKKGEKLTDLFPEEIGLIIDTWNLQHEMDEDYVKRYKPGETDPWKEAMEGLPISAGGYLAADFLEEMKALGFDDEEDIPVIRSLYEISAVSTDFNILDHMSSGREPEIKDYDDALDFVFDQAQKPANKEIFRTHGAQMQTLYDYYNEYAGEHRREPAYEIDPKHNMLRTAEDMVQIKKLNAHIDKIREAAPEVDDLGRRYQHLIYGDHDLRNLAEMFNTKKTLRFLQGGDSREYKEARDCLNDYMTSLDGIRKELKDSRKKLDDGTFTREEYEKDIKERIDGLKEKEKALRAAMGVYAVKVTKGDRETGTLGDKRIEDMTDTGAARLASAMCIMDLFDTADVLIGNWQATYGEVRDEERVKETSFAKLYAEKFSEIGNEKNRHRRAAAYAKQQIKEEKAMPGPLGL